MTVSPSCVFWALVLAARCQDDPVVLEALDGERCSLFKTFDLQLAQAGYSARGGQIVDASLIGCTAATVARG